MILYNILTSQCKKREVTWNGSLEMYPTDEQIEKTKIVS